MGDHEVAREPFRRVPQRAGWVNPSRLPRGPNGRALCRRCGVEVPRGLRTFCGAACVHEWKIRTNPGYARQQVEARDRGVCASCGLDTRAASPLLRRVQHQIGVIEGRVRFLPSPVPSDPDRGFWVRTPRDRVPALRGTAKSIARAATDVRNLLDAGWQMDHVIPVVEGGGDCGLENLRTLCSWCHREATTALARRRAGRTAVRWTFNLVGTTC